MLHRPFGNLDDLIPTEKPFVNKSKDNILRIGIVEDVNSSTFVVKVRDVKTGSRGIECFVLQSQFSTIDKTGTYVLPVPDSKVMYYLTGGNKGYILGNAVTGILDPKKDFSDDVTGNPGFENFVDANSQLEGDIPSDFGWGAGDFGWFNKKGKIKLTSAGIIVLKSAPFCYQYMLPAKQARLSSFLYDEERGIGYVRRRRTFICPYPGLNFNSNYQIEQTEDIPSEPQALIREEKGFCDKSTAFSSMNHGGDSDITGNIQSSINSSLEVIRARAIKRTTIAKTKKVSGERVLFLPVYKREERIDGTVVEQIGHVPKDPFYSLEVVKSPTGYLHVICRQGGKVPTAILKMNAVDGTIEIAANALTLTSLIAPITLVAAGVNIEGNLININGDQVNINAQTAMTINAPSINSYPVPQPRATQLPQAVTANLLPVDLDNTPLDEQNIGDPNIAGD
jgi:hypothetical protein